MAGNTGTLSIEDWDGKTGQTSINTGPITAANYTAKHAAIDAYGTAVEGIISGELRKITVTEVFAKSSDPVASSAAQRHVKWVVTYRDDTEFLDVGDTINNVGYGRLFTIEIPTADLSLLTNNSRLLDITGGVGLAYANAFAGVQNSPTGGNECSVVRVELND